MIKTITVYAKRYKNSKNQEYYRYTSEICGQWYNIKFARKAGKQPDKSGIYDVTVDSAQVFMVESEEYIDKEGIKRQGNPTIWVRGYTMLEDVTENHRDDSAREIEEIFKKI